MGKRIEVDEDEIVRLYVSGASLLDLSRRFPRSEGGIRLILKRHGVKRRRVGGVAKGPLTRDVLRERWRRWKRTKRERDRQREKANSLI